MTAAAPGKGRAATIARAVVAATIAGAILGLAGPFGSYLNGSAEYRIAYWVVSMWFGVVVYGAAVVSILPLARRSEIPPRIVGVFLVIIASIPQAIVTRMLALWFWPELAHIPIGLLVWYLQVLLVAELLVLGYARWTGLLQLPSSPAALTADAASDDDASIWAQLSPRLGREILCLAMEDHYVRVHTPLGAELLLMPMARAIAGLTGIEGMRVHRSWWVARAAVTGIDGPARSMRLRLVNGLTVPVARRAVADLRAGGWLTDAQ
ncbi:LytTR family transcriptional regulator DNA-binding domain-containing protein [Sphingomonas sp. RT2P30]|uniref:LytTR family DNA-binding domain-containing protein n=1 Tax=Parasphingomonas halimpatiens TaxID=3096162 RepID=UPI002FCAEDE5